MMEETSDNSNEWFEVSEDLWRDPGQMPRKLRLLADEDVPGAFIEELRKVNIDVVTVRDLGLAGREDKQIFGEARRRGRVLLTMDRGFWDVRKYPLSSGGGVILVDAGTGLMRNLKAFGLLFGCFARSFPGDWTRGIRARAKERHFILKLKNAKETYEMKLKGGRLYARCDISPDEILYGRET